MPIHDWQFWVVTLATLAAALYLVRGLLPRRWRLRSPGRQRTTLTIEGRPRDRTSDRTSDRP